MAEQVGWLGVAEVEPGDDPRKGGQQLISNRPSVDGVEGILEVDFEGRVARFGGVVHPDPGRLNNSVGPVFNPHPELSHLLEDPVDFAFDILVVEDEFPDQPPNNLAYRNRADAPVFLLEGEDGRARQPGSGRCRLPGRSRFFPVPL